MTDTEVSRPAEEPAVPPKPDITTDRLLVVIGATCLPVHRMVEVTELPAVWVTAAQTEFLTEPEKELGVPDRLFRVMLDAKIGTVAELVKDFEDGLTRVFNAVALKDKDGNHAVIPEFGEVSLRQQTAVFERNNLLPRQGCSVLGGLKITPEKYQELTDRRDARFGYPKPRQSAIERDLLKRVVAHYLFARYTEAYKDVSVSERAFLDRGPSDRPSDVQLLIDALTTLKEDAEARLATQAAFPKLTEEAAPE